MSKIADRIVLDIRDQTLTIDGQPFPWAILKNDIKVLTDDDMMCGLTVTILTNQRVEVIDPDVPQ